MHHTYNKKHKFYYKNNNRKTTKNITRKTYNNKRYNGGGGMLSSRAHIENVENIVIMMNNTVQSLNTTIGLINNVIESHNTWLFLVNAWHNAWFAVYNATNNNADDDTIDILTNTRKEAFTSMKTAKNNAINAANVGNDSIIVSRRAVVAAVNAYNTIEYWLIYSVSDNLNDSVYDAYRNVIQTRDNLRNAINISHSTINNTNNQANILYAAVQAASMGINDFNVGAIPSVAGGRKFKIKRNKSTKQNTKRNTKKTKPNIR